MTGSETWFGGEKGVEVTENFLEECGEYLSPGGKALMVLSSLASIDDLIEGYKLEVVSSEKIWFETLYLARYCVE